MFNQLGIFKAPSAAWLALYMNITIAMKFNYILRKSLGWKTCDLRNNIKWHNRLREISEGAVASRDDGEHLLLGQPMLILHNT